MKLWPRSKASRLVSMHLSSCSRKESSSFAPPRPSSTRRRPKFTCCWRNRTADSSYGRWISSEVSAQFAADREGIERRLDEICDNYLADLPAGIAAAVQYGLKSPGKRVRPLLLLFAYR